MHGFLRQRWWQWGVAVLLVTCRSVSAQPTGDPHLQLFSTVDHEVVAVGQAFRVEVEAYASPATGMDAARVVQAFVAGGFVDESDSAFEYVRTAPVTTQEGTGPLVLRRAFVVRARRAGSLYVPSFQLTFDDVAYRTPTHHVTAFEVDPVFFERDASIVPIVAEGPARHGQRPLREGTAFLVGPDAFVTSFHVVLDARRVRLELPGGRRITTRKAWVLDPVHDVAILHVDPGDVAEAGLRPLNMAPLGDVREALPGAREDRVVFTNGWPGGTRASTAGVRFRSADRSPEEALWVTSNAVRPGDSGGPLLDPRGRVLGVVVSGTIGHGSHEVLHEEVCIALDPRPALARKRRVARPRSLRALMRDPAFRATPYVQALRLVTLLTAGHRRIPELESSLARLDGSRDDLPSSARLHFLRGVIYQLLGTYGDAAQAYESSLAIDEDYFLATYMLGVHHLRQRDYSTAERLFLRTQQYEPYVHLASYGLARALMGRLQYAAAAEQLRRVAAYDPAFAPALYDLGVCLLALGDVPRMRQIMAKLRTVSPRRARRLAHVLRDPLLHPERLHEMPRAQLHIAGE